MSSQCESLPDSSDDVMEVTDFWLVSEGMSAAGLFSSGVSLRTGKGLKPRTLKDSFNLTVRPGGCGTRPTW